MDILFDTKTDSQSLKKNELLTYVYIYIYVKILFSVLLN